MGLVSRAVAICVRPASEWHVIAPEPTPPARVLLRYLLPLAALAALTGVLVSWGSLLEWSKPGRAAWPMLRIGFFHVVVAVVTVSAAAFVIDAFATTFHGTPDRMQAFKLAAYAYTPMVLATLVGTAMSSPVIVLALYAAMAYSVYLLVVGIPLLMRTPADRALPYALVAAAFAFLASRFVGAGLLPFLRF